MVPMPPRSERIPALSVMMPVHNALPYLDQAVESILRQTMPDFELLIVDDASTDGSTERLRHWEDSDDRIRLFHSPSPLGVCRAPNFLGPHCRAPLIARMDADDISRPERFASELPLFEQNPDVSLVATLWEGIDEQGRRVRSRDRWRLLRGRPWAPFPHGSVMFRRTLWEAVGGYREEALFWEDFDLYLRLLHHGRILVIPEALYLYRFHPSGTRLQSGNERLTRAIHALNRYVADWRESDRAPAEPPPDEESVRAYIAFTQGTTRLWAGRRPGILAQAARLSPFRSATWKVWLLGLIGTPAPRLLRLLLDLTIRIRDRIASRRIVSGEPIEWRFR